MAAGRAARLTNRPGIADLCGRRRQGLPAPSLEVGTSQFARESGLAITVGRFPPGTGKYNKIEHCLFSPISSNWRGQPLISREVIVDLIGATTTRRGLRVKAALDTGTYPSALRISDADFVRLPVSLHSFHGEWNYTISPRPQDPPKWP